MTRIPYVESEAQKCLKQATLAIRLSTNSNNFWYWQTFPMSHSCSLQPAAGHGMVNAFASDYTRIGGLHRHYVSRLVLCCNSRV